MAVKKWSAVTAKGAPVGADKILIVDSADGLNKLVLLSALPVQDSIETRLGGAGAPSAADLMLVKDGSEGGFDARLDTLETNMVDASLFTAIGDLITFSGAGAPARLPASTANYVLTANGPGVAPSWQATQDPVSVTALPTTGNYRSYGPLENVLLATAGGVAKYDPVYVLAAGTVGKAVSSATKQVCIGICVVAADEAAAPTIMSRGLITNSSWAFTIGAQIFVSATGTLTETCPSTADFWTQAIGVAVSATCVRIELGPMVKV